jgi:hypothetical protein
VDELQARLMPLLAPLSPKRSSRRVNQSQEVALLPFSTGEQKSRSRSLRVFEGWPMARRKWTEREYQAFKEWEKRFDRPIWWMLGVVIFLPAFGLLLSAMTK